MTINDELKIYDDAFKNYLWVKVFDDNGFAIIKSNCLIEISDEHPRLFYMGVPPPPGFYTALPRFMSVQPRVTSHSFS